ncbi:glycosyltransferase family 39 protein [Nocardioides aequoreus]|uniref:glycosyltransferase family 39 protein n=1 Tax=Nocardioides aequoreus TaxID=397278 RepID=UPI000690071A|nr:glycosyltransferase family 39 protein [Nocardioides aequoreus]
MWRGDPDEPAWARPALLALLGGTALLYLWGLGESGWANSFYSAAAQAGSESWTAFFFGSSDAGNAITVDKTPLALWPMALSVRLFGLSTWSILVPQALMGVATVWLLHRTVRRTTGSAAAGLVAGAVMALTPVAVLMFRFNNPDALLVLLLVGSAAATLRAVEEARPEAGAGRPVRWLVLAGALVGLAFLAKMLQAFLVLPALGLTYLLFARTPVGRRLLHLLAALGAMLLAGGWWVAVVELWPAGSRPYIGGSQSDSILELTLGYNGLGRLNGEETGSVGGQMGWGETGLLRLFDSEIGGQVAWLLPAALVLGAVALWLVRRHARLAPALTLWLTWLVVTGLTFSLMAGIFHAYYTVALAPAVAALVGVGGWVLWERRDRLVATGTLAFAAALTAVLGFALLSRAEGFAPGLRWVVLVGGLGCALLLAGLGRLPRRLAAVAVVASLVVALAGPAAYSLSTAATPHTGSIPSAGPSTGGFGGGMPGGMPGAARGQAPGGATGQAPGGATGGPGGGVGGLLSGSESTTEITALLQQDAALYTWAAATVGSNSAAGYQLASEEPVMSIGGFNGSDPSPTLAQFQEYVASGQVHWFISGGGAGPGGSQGGSSTAAEITAWVESSFTAQTVDGVTMYDLSGGAR